MTEEEQEIIQQVLETFTVLEFETPDGPCHIERVGSHLVVERTIYGDDDTKAFQQLRDNEWIDPDDEGKPLGDAHPNVITAFQALTSVSKIGQYPEHLFHLLAFAGSADEIVFIGSYEIAGESPITIDVTYWLSRVSHGNEERKVTKRLRPRGLNHDIASYSLTESGQMWTEVGTGQEYHFPSFVPALETFMGTHPTIDGWWGESEPSSVT